MTMMGWRFLYWAFFTVGAAGVTLGLAAFVRTASNRRRRTLIVTAAALLLAGVSGAVIVAAAGPGGFGPNMMGMGGMGMMSDRNDIRPAPPASPGAREQAVSAREFSFSPTEIHVQAGTTTNVEFHNEGSIFHTFTVSDLSFELEANGGQSSTGAFRADRPGTYDFICAVVGHAQSGMRGRIIVT